MDQNPNSSRALDRKTIEKNRRNEMKTLHSKLNSLIPHQFLPRGMASLPDQIEGATNYIKTLQAKVEKMKQKKNCLIGISANNWSSNCLPNVDVRVTGSALELVLITGLNCESMFNGIIKLLHEEEGVEVVSTSLSRLDSTVFHSVHAKIGDCDAARISGRLRKFVYEYLKKGRI